MKQNQLIDHVIYINNQTKAASSMTHSENKTESQQNMKTNTTIQK